MRSLSMLILLMGSPAWAADDEPMEPSATEGGEVDLPDVPQERATEADQSEAMRLGQEMKTLAKRDAWSGVDRNYEALVATGVEVSGSLHTLGAQASRALGDAGAAYSRGIRAARADEQTVLNADLRAIHDTYARLTVRRVDDSGISLEPAEMPFEPDLRAAIEHARTTLSQTGGFDGLLPLGTYTIGGQYTVELDEGAGAHVVRRGRADQDVGASASSPTQDMPPEPAQEAVDEPISEQVINKVADGHAKKIAACQLDERKAGVVSLDFTVRDGQVTAVSVGDDSTSEGVADCLVAVVGRWSFSKKVSGVGTWSAAFTDGGAQ